MVNVIAPKFRETEHSKLRKREIKADRKEILTKSDEQHAKNIELSLDAIIANDKKNKK